MTPEHLAKMNAARIAMGPEKIAAAKAKAAAIMKSPEYKAAQTLRMKAWWAKRRGLTAPPAAVEAPPLVTTEPEPTNGSSNGNGSHEEPTNGHKRRMIRWTYEEQKALASRTAQLLREQNIFHLPDPKDGVGRRFLMEFFRAAQLDVLEQGRRRLAADGQSAGDGFWAILRDELKHGARNRPAAAPATNGSAPHVEAPPPKTEESAQPVSEATLAQLVMMTATRIVHEITQLSAANEMLLKDVGELQDEVRKVYKELADVRNAIPKNAVVTKRPIVAVLGCYKHQFDNIEHGVRSLGLDIELRHFDEDQNPRLFQADYAIAMRFMSHAWDDKAKKAVPTGHYVFLGAGGISSVVNQLKAWFPQ